MSALLNQQILAHVLQDLFLIHWPGAGGLDPKDPSNAALRRQSWEVLAQYQRKGAIRCVGVSNYTPAHLDDLAANAKEGTPKAPQVNQVGGKPFNLLLF